MSAISVPRRRRPVAPDLPKYESVAAHVIKLLDGGTFRPGERITSVRKLASQLSVSVTTILGAYRLLEDRGYIEARPQSGYFARSPVQRLAPRANEPAMARTKVGTPTHVSIEDLWVMVLRDTRNPELLKLGSAVPDMALLPTLKLNRTMARMARQLGARANQYEITPGYQELRVQVARREITAGCTLTPDEIIITCGGQEAITLCLRALCKAGDTIAIESPSYYGFLQAMESLGLKALEIPTHPRDGMSIEALEYALNEHDVKAVMVIANYNNPLGSCMPTERKKQLVELLARRTLPLIEDDIYGDLSYAHDRPLTCKAFDEQGLVLLCDSFSKTLAPGYRVGWVAPGRFYDEMVYLKTVHTLASPTLPQITIADFLANGGYESHLRRLRKVLQKRTMAMAEAIETFFPTGTKVTHPTGGHVLWVEMPEGIDSLKLYEQAIANGITIAPGPLFSPKQKYTNCVRLNAAHWSDRARDAIKTLARLANAQL